HLLVEEALTDALIFKAENPKYIVEARLTFANKYKMVRAFYDHSCESWIWTSISMLNKTRNRLAHNLSPQEVEEDINQFILFVKNNQPMWVDGMLTVNHSNFFWAIFLIFSEIRSLTSIE
ncbi:hypothetical protein, partial [Photobacterium sanguinicancri]